VQRKTAVKKKATRAPANPAPHSKTSSKANQNTDRPFFPMAKRLAGEKAD